MFYILYPIPYCILHVLGDKGSGKAAMMEVKLKKSNFFESREENLLYTYDDMHYGSYVTFCCTEIF